MTFESGRWVVCFAMVVVLWGCGGDDDDDDDDVVNVDAASPDAAPSADAGCLANVVYLNFEGVTLTEGAEDATLNQADWLRPETPTATAGPWLGGVTDRQTRIDAIVAQLETTLGAYEVQLVTERPAAGPYDMVVFGGSSVDFGFSAETLGIATVDCTGDEIESGVGIIFEGGQSDVAAANGAVFELGLGHGVAPTETANDCMCATCGALETPCEMASNATVAEPHQIGCGAPATQDTGAAFAAGFDCR